jgi:plastocyanin
MLLAALAAGCSGSKPSSPAAAVAPAAHAPAASPAPGSAGTVSGKVSASGGAAVIVLEPKTPRAFAPQAEKPVMDQVGLTFGPELLVVRTGEPVEFRNNDDTLHNVNVKNEETREQAFNVAIPSGGLYAFTFAQDGVYNVTCDIHPEMMAWVVAAPSPFATQTKADGSFSFDDVPAGPYVVVAYVDKRKVEQDIDVGGAEGAEEKITVDAQGS